MDKYRVVTKFNEYPEIVQDANGISWEEAKNQCMRAIIDELVCMHSFDEDSYFAEYSHNGN